MIAEFKLRILLKRAKSQHHSSTLIVTPEKTPFLPEKTAKTPEKLIVFQRFCRGQHFYPLNMVEVVRVELTSYSAAKRLSTYLVCLLT